MQPKVKGVNSGCAARNEEELLLRVCLQAIQSKTPSIDQAKDTREAHVLLFIGRAIATAWPQEGAKLQAVGLAWISSHPSELLSFTEFIQSGWVIGVPRFRDMLSNRISFLKPEDINRESGDHQAEGGQRPQ